jgi:fumarate reductase subunit C
MQIANAIQDKPPNTSLSYTKYHPRWYRLHVSVYWWLGDWRYVRFILREISSVFVATFVIVTLLQIYALRQGPETYARFQAWLHTPSAIALNVVSFFFVLLHTITWFNLAPHAMAVRLRGKRVPDITIAAPNYVAWIVVSALLFWVVRK